MVPDHFIDNEAQEFFAEFGVQVSFRCQGAKSLDLPRFTLGIGRRKRSLRLILANSLGYAKSLCQNVNQRGIDVIDTAAEGGKLGICGGIGHQSALSGGC